MMDRSLFLDISLILDVEGFCDSAFKGPNSAIISDRFHYVGTEVGVLIGFCFPRVLQ